MTCCNAPMTTLYADGTRWQWRDTAAEACFPREQNYTGIGGICYEPSKRSE